MHLHVYNPGILLSVDNRTQESRCRCKSVNAPTCR